MAENDKPLRERGDPYITIQASAPLDSRWTAGLWFAWSRLVATCRIKRACTAETWPAAVLKLRFLEAAAILNAPPNKVRQTLNNLSMVASITVQYPPDAKLYEVLISVDNYAKYQKLGRPTSAKPKHEHGVPPIGLRSPVSGSDPRKTSSSSASTQKADVEERVRALPEAGVDEALVGEVLATLHEDAEKPSVTLRRIVARLPAGEVRRLAVEARTRFVDGIASNAGAYFVACAKNLATERGIDLGLRN